MLPVKNKFKDSLEDLRGIQNTMGSDTETDDEGSELSDTDSLDQTSDDEDDDRNDCQGPVVVIETNDPNSSQHAARRPELLHLGLDEPESTVHTSDEVINERMIVSDQAATGDSAQTNSPRENPAEKSEDLNVQRTVEGHKALRKQDPIIPVRMVRSQSRLCKRC